MKLRTPALSVILADPDFDREMYAELLELAAGDVSLSRGRWFKDRGANAAEWLTYANDMVRNYRERVFFRRIPGVS